MEVLCRANLDPWESQGAIPGTTRPLDGRNPPGTPEPRASWRKDTIRNSPELGIVSPEPHSYLTFVSVLKPEGRCEGPASGSMAFGASIFVGVADAW
jgi:hypothetical protein